MARKKLSTFGRFRRREFLSFEQCAATFEVTVRTIRNWEYRELPRWVLREIQRQDRQLSGIHPDWPGFRIGWNGKLYGPYGFQISADHLRHLALSQHLTRKPVITPGHGNKD